MGRICDTKDELATFGVVEGRKDELWEGLGRLSRRSIKSLVYVWYYPPTRAGRIWRMVQVVVLS